MTPDLMGKYLVMVIDDEQDVASLVKMVLEGEGHQVITALSGHEALQMLYQVKPDLILLDIMMPGLDGMEFIKIVKIIDSTAQIPIAMMTAKTSPEDRAAALREKAVEYICKPFTAAELAEKVNQILASGSK
jgi:DNA-binding response OmpR family regulator